MPNHAIIDDSFFQSAPGRFTMQQPLAASTKAVFDSFASPDDWTKWLGVREVRYLTGPPHGVGTRREIRQGPARVVEEITAWDPGHRFAFRLVRSPLPARAIAEEYILEVVSPDRTILHWTVAVDGRVAPVTKAVTALMRSIGRRSLPVLASLLESQAGPES